MGKHYKGLTALFVSAVFFLQPISLNAEAVTEYQLKAVFIYNFAHFVTFPKQQATDRPFTFCIFENNLLEQALQLTIEDQVINGAPARLVKLNREQSPDECRIVYFPDSEKIHLKQMLSGLQGKPILTVSSIDGFANAGGMIQFIRKNNKIKLIINNDNAKTAGLRIKANLLNIAIVVGN